MNTLSKILVPAFIAFAAFGAQAATGQDPAYGSAVVGTVTAAESAAAASAVGVNFIGQEGARSQSKPATLKTREEVRRQAAQPARVSADYIA